MYVRKHTVVQFSTRKQSNLPGEFYLNILQFDFISKVCMHIKWKINVRVPVCNQMPYRSDAHQFKYNEQKKKEKENRRINLFG